MSGHGRRGRTGLLPVLFSAGKGSLDFQPMYLAESTPVKERTSFAHPPSAAPGECIRRWLPHTMTMHPSEAPVLDPQPWHAAEFARVVGDHCELVGNGDRGNHEIVAPNQFPPQLEVMADIGVGGRRSVIEGKRTIDPDGPFNFLTPCIRIAIFARTMKEFGPNNGTDGNLRRICRLEPIPNSRIRVLQIHNPNVGIDEKTHHQSPSGTGGGSSGASRVSPSKLPAVSSKYRSGHPRASFAGLSGSARENSIKSLTTRSSLLAESASSSRSLFSNSAAIALMGYMISRSVRNSRR
jgi:hypothetical protein